MRRAPPHQERLFEPEDVLVDRRSCVLKCERKTVVEI